MTKIVLDLDGTITIDDKATPYHLKVPREGILTKISYYKNLGYEIVIHTARNMNTYNGDLDLIKLNTLPVILDWLALHQIPYDEIIVGKPWCGQGGFYVDDRAIRPSEFVSLSPEEIEELLASSV